MLKKWVLCAVLGAIALGGCSGDKSRGDEVTAVSNDDAAMNAALAKGRATLPQFVAVLKNPQPLQNGFAVYARFKEGEQVEYLWLSPVELSGSDFRGTVNNEPGMVRGVKLGQTVTVPAADVADWMYVEDKKLVGAQTTRVLRDQMSAAERADFDGSLPYRVE